MSAGGSVTVGLAEKTVFFKVEGKGTFQSSVGLKEAVQKMIQKGYREFVVDLEDCELMDSTFMGTLAGAALRLRELGQGGLTVIRANERSRELLTGLGLDQIFRVVGGGGSAEASPVSTIAATGSASEEDRRQAALEAHEALVRASSANAVKFRDVIEFLKREGGGGGSGGES